MLKIIKYSLIYILLLYILLISITNPNIVINSINNATNIFIYKLFPSMFFFYTLTDLLVNYKFIYLISRLIDRPSKYLLHIDGLSSTIIILSMLSGFPSGSKYIVSFKEDKLINKEISEYLITFTHFVNPLFLLSILNKKEAYVIIIITFISNIILAFIIRPKKIISNKILKNKTLKIDELLTKSFNRNIKIFILVYLNTCLFFILSNTITNYINNTIIKILILGLIDLSKGLTSTNNLSIFNRILLSITFISLGGLNISIQVKSIIKKENISYKYFLFGRLASLGISIFLLICFTETIINWCK